MAHLYWCEHWKWECRQQKLNSPVIIKPCGLGFLPKFIQIRKEERHVWTRHFEDTVMHLPRKFTLSVFEVLAFDLYQIYIYILYICIYTYLPCMSACFGLVCISHQFFRWSQGLFGVRTAVLAASSEVHPDVCYRGMVRRWAYHIKTECETGSNHGKGAITAKKKTIAPKYLLRLVFWFERYLSVFDLSIRSHLHLQGEVRSFAPILPSQQQLTGRSKRLDSMV